MQSELRIDDLPEDAIDAASAFYASWLGRVAEALAENESLAIVLPSARYDHDDWRRAAARDLARGHAPKRINIVAQGHENATAATLAYLADAPGVTGQYFKAS